MKKNIFLFFFIFINNLQAAELTQVESPSAIVLSNEKIIDWYDKNIANLKKYEQALLASYSFAKSQNLNQEFIRERMSKQWHKFKTLVHNNKSFKKAIKEAIASDNEYWKTQSELFKKDFIPKRAISAIKKRWHARYYFITFKLGELSKAQTRANSSDQTNESKSISNIVQVREKSRFLGTFFPMDE